MRGRDDRSGGLFSYVRLEERVPADHPLRPIRALADEALAALNGRFEGLYSSMGRPSIPPEMLLRATLLQAFFSVRSERMLMEQIIIAHTNSMRSSRPTMLAARKRLSIVAPPLSGSSKRSTCARLVFMSSAIRFLVMRFFFISSASWRAITALIAAAVTSERIPASSSQLSKLDPIWRCFLVMTTPPSYVPVPALMLPAGSSALS